MMDEKDFGYLVEQLNMLLRDTPIRMGVVNQTVLDMFDDLDPDLSPVGVNGFELMTYSRLKEEHVLFFSSKEDAQEFVDACEECIKDTPNADPEALVGVIIELQKQRLIMGNKRFNKELDNATKDIE